MEDNFPRSVAAYKNFDVLLVNAVRDGMNLVAKESVVINEKNGVLVLSENAGAHEELGEHALTVNPFDVDEQADAIHQALTMPDEGARAPGEGAARDRDEQHHRRLGRGADGRHSRVPEDARVGRLARLRRDLGRPLWSANLALYRVRGFLAALIGDDAGELPWAVCLVGARALSLSSSAF